MHGRIPAASAAAISTTVQTVRGNSVPESSDQTVSDECGRFARAAPVLLGSDPGIALHLLTGCAERTGYRYASGDRSPPEHVITALLRSGHGWQWLSAIMEGHQPEWWRDLQRARRVVAQLDAIDMG